MTTIIKSDVTLSAAAAGSLILPSLGISGIQHRWHADTAVGTVGGNITKLNDYVGDADLSTIAGSVGLRADAGGRRYLDFGQGASQNMISAGYIKDYTSYSLAALYYWDVIPASSTSFLSTQIPGSTLGGLNLLNLRYGVGTWNTSGAAVVSGSSAPVPGPGWHTIFVGYDKTGNEMAAIDGAKIQRGQGHGVVDAQIKVFGLRGPDGLHAKLVDAVYVDHVLSDAEIATLHTRLMAQLPAV